MEKFATLEPVRLYSSTTNRLFNNRGSKAYSTAPRIGVFPTEIHVLILSFLPVPDIPAYALCSRATASLVSKTDSHWERRWKSLSSDFAAVDSVLDELDSIIKTKLGQSKTSAPPTILVDDDFGDFACGDSFAAASADEMGDFVGAFTGVSVVPTFPEVSSATYRVKYIRAHKLLTTLTPVLMASPHLILSEMSTKFPSGTYPRARTLHLLCLFLAPSVQPLRNWQSLAVSLRAAMDRFDAGLLASFEEADRRGDEQAMRDATISSWELFDGPGDWEMGKVWAEKLEIFYESERWKPLDNFTADGALQFDAMDSFMSAISQSIIEHGSRAIRVFPSQSHVLLNFAERVANDVVGEYILTLLARARELSTSTFLKATAASFGEAFRMVKAILTASKAEMPRKYIAEVSPFVVTESQAEDVVYRMFEVNMDEYLDEEIEGVKIIFDQVCRGWSREHSEEIATATGQSFLASQNPAQMKRNVLKSFTDVLLLPVTIVPRTVNVVGEGIATVGTAAFQGISMLNPQRWVGTRSTYSQNGMDLEEENTVFEIGEDDEGAEDSKRSSSVTTATRDTDNVSLRSSATSYSVPVDTVANKMELLLSLDVALQLIHASRESLKRVETFAQYPGTYGHRVRDTIEEIFILLLQATNEKHITVGFQEAIEQMTRYQPKSQEDGNNVAVAPLFQFFELVHIGDTIQSMIQVYFEKELAPHIDRTDFLNPVIREKKRFENSLDDSVAAGLNTGTDLLMNQVEYIIMTLTEPRAYCPPEDMDLDLGPTRGCKEAIKCLQVHCKLLKGSTNREVLDVFNQEVGIRLIAILQKHIKRQIISLTGGFQVIADLNAYHSFITSLKIPAITSDFAHLKMLGHVYVVEDAKDLAQIVRDVTRYGGAYKPEDIYEFIQRRADWKKIEKTVDKAMYNLSFKEDCIIC
ncbi:hypothetical protein FISHEDRAFT_66826 [Fistulina hepatica ATCC 64428]|uniref:F-box domain-containing protein n=1 Tax=Fistulina hepatica ATCC 64428 TaxID=1128425 RepID=A0A0D7A420_9AGAR|nr:hypothetical protein FISHEDRAFT_66826 [Fistulina hepatica ATCC 64428]